VKKSSYFSFPSENFIIKDRKNPAVDTGTIYLPPMEFFFKSPTAKSYGGKSWQVTTETAGKFRPVKVIVVGCITIKTV
jgi:hypothetical protein